MSRRFRPIIADFEVLALKQYLIEFVYDLLRFGLKLGILELVVVGETTFGLFYFFLFYLNSPYLLFKCVGTTFYSFFLFVWRPVTFLFSPVTDILLSILYCE